MHCPLPLAETPQSRQQQKTGAPASSARPRRHAVVLKLRVKPKSKDVFGSFQMVAGEHSERPGTDTEPHQTCACPLATPCGKFVAVSVACSLVPAIGPATAAGCTFEPQGEGRVGAV